MRSSVGLCVLGLMCLHNSVFGQDAAGDHQSVLIFCDDPLVEKAVHSAVHKFNEELSSGHKLALFQILRGSKSENGTHWVYSLQFTSRRTECPAESPAHWTTCAYLHVDKKPISCNATVFMSDNNAHASQVDCMLDDYITPERASCLGCPEEIDVNSEDLKGPLSASISKYNSMSDSPHLFTLNSIGHATRQVVAGFRFKLKFDMQKTTCAKAEHNDLNDLCVLDEENKEFANCNSTVDVAPWRLEPPQAQIECEPGLLPMVLTKRRPPGWSPLRHFMMAVPPSSITTPPPTQASAKEESSEEDTATSKPSTSPDNAVNDSPFHCPSKPWKAFSPSFAAPTKVTIEETSPHPTVDGAFSDKDLQA
ncbi:kininogen-1 [Chaetodon trifascialis]|uniref:kininogen-1 n=1 Tax=Chaetodon trifascialis TaxID=109706 RepID=UPI0039956D76